MISSQEVFKKYFPQLAENTLRHKLLSSLCKNLLHEAEFINFADRYPTLRGFDLIEKTLEYFDFSFATVDKQIERIPTTGRVVIIANHPIGTLDGLALLHLVRKLRSDVKVVANELLMEIKPLHDVLLPVNNMSGGTAKEDLLNINQFLANDGALIIFPAGEVSRFTPTGIKDCAWQKGFLKIAARAKAPILPIHIKARNSWVFYTSSFFYKPLASLLLIKEMFKHNEQSIKISIGKLIPFDSYGKSNLTTKVKVNLLQKEVYRVAKNKLSYFKTESVIAHPVARVELKQAIEKCQLLGNTSDGKSIYLLDKPDHGIILKELGRCREVTFRAVGEGTGEKRDLDKYDLEYMHLILWDQQDLEVVGAYRFAPTARLIENQGIGGLYSNQLFEYKADMQPYFERGIELGRSFVQPRYWGKRSLEYLWQGIGAYLAMNPDIRYLFGPVSLSASLPKKAHSYLVYFYQLYFPTQADLACARNSYSVSEELDNELFHYFSGDNYAKDFMKLKTMMNNMGVSVPTLYKQYTELCYEGGVQFVDFNIDPDFNYCIDGLVVVDLTYLKEKKQSRYIDIHLAENEKHIISH
ncbi:lysophospholipid acyltransferase family protein [Psychromonas algicola]|uniref:lysophospholipid acyltransferase family protein n=1 Tax=Psychromonas algicola TaxID=2555642 RepID=UPI0010675B14|nr:GNAT family N-acyltransferase [Psychromonas sp. RZ5]TEW50196.1 lysophospholipid acyltransferase family protein [Psychromonas sp. RZ5]